MPFDASNLHRDEQIVLDLHPHWIMLVKGVVILVVTIALGIWVLTWELSGTTEQIVKTAAGIAIIYQELSLAPNLTVAENIYLGNEPKQFGVLADRATMRR